MKASTRTWTKKKRTKRDRTQEQGSNRGPHTSRENLFKALKAFAGSHFNYDFNENTKNVIFQFFLPFHGII